MNLHEERDRHVLLIVDEMHIKEDLVFVKHSGSIKYIYIYIYIFFFFLCINNTVFNECTKVQNPRYKDVILNA